MPDETNAQQTPNEGGEKKPSGAERRIGQLYARAATAEERVSALETQHAELQSQNQELQRQLLITQGQKATAPDPLQTDAVDANTSGVSDLKGLIKGELKEALTGFKEELHAERYQEKLVQSHKASLEMAAREDPRLQDTNSKLYQYVDHVFRNDPGLQADPHGPMKALLIVRGAMAEDESAGDVRKTAASVPTGTGADTQGGKQADVDTLKTHLADVQTKMRRNQGDPGQLWREYRNTKLALAKAEGKEIGPVISEKKYS